MEERDFFDERTEKKLATLNCPHCHQPAEYEVTWVVRTKKRQLAGRADERDRARFAKARSYMLRKDDLMACKNMRCRKRLRFPGCSPSSSPNKCRPINLCANCRPLIYTGGFPCGFRKPQERRSHV